MAELKGLILGTHLKAIQREFKAKQSIYGYPEQHIFRGFPDHDISVGFHDKTAFTPLGPASGPHSQLAQNILLSFLAGGRIMELKTVQILDALDVPRPCIDVRNVGYNVEWSQELSLTASYREYVTAWVLLKLIEELEILGVPKGHPFYNMIFDVSVGYDLAGIASAEVHCWLTQMRDASAMITELLRALPEEYAAYRELDIDPKIANSVTLSTFHGCPPDEIEAIVKHLIEEHQFHVIVKLNPTILGFDTVNQLLRHDLGYHGISLDPEAFQHDLKFDDAVAMMKRLELFAQEHGKYLGAKFTNTLVVQNTEAIFTDQQMYLSGPPLHVLAMNAMKLFRQAMGATFPISFSAGIDRHNVVDSLACNMRPVTVCTDLLKTGGYTRLREYLASLQQAMLAQGSQTLAAFIISTAGDERLSVSEAGQHNSDALVPQLIHEPRYQQAKNLRAPPKLDSQLELFDCLTCHKCLPVCPNAANFSFRTGTVSLPVTHYQLRDGQLTARAGERLTLHREEQIANLADFCNECGNCDTYCPEQGGPFIEKPRFFSDASSYQQDSSKDGFFFPTAHSFRGRMSGREYQLSVDDQQQRYQWQSDDYTLTLDWNHQLLASDITAEQVTDIDMTPYYSMMILFQAVRDASDDYPAVILHSHMDVEA